MVFAEPRRGDQHLRVESVDPGGVVAKVNAGEAQRLAHDAGVRRILRPGDYIMAVNNEVGAFRMIAEIAASQSQSQSLLLRLEVGRRREELPQGGMPMEDWHATRSAKRRRGEELALHGGTKRNCLRRDFAAVC